jgi:hypothetical protein
MACYIGSAAGTADFSSKGPYQPETVRRDFDDGANALWSLYGKEAKTHDEARIQRLAADMDGIPTFVSILLCSTLARTHPRVSIGRLVCWRSHFLPCSKYSEFAS